MGTTAETGLAATAQARGAGMEESVQDKVGVEGVVDYSSVGRPV